MHLLDKWEYETLTDVMALGPGLHPKPSRTVALLFQQPSTRTHLSFMTAINCLGYAAFDLGASTSIEKGETLADTLRVIDAMGVDLAVVRTPDDLCCRARSAVTAIAGDKRRRRPPPPHTSSNRRLYPVRALRHHGPNGQDGRHHRRLEVVGLHRRLSKHWACWARKCCGAGRPLGGASRGWARQ